MSRSPKRPSAARAELPEVYWEESRRPFPILVFLLPLIIIYEVCLVRLLRTQDGFAIHTVEAHRQLLQFFDAAGINPATALHFGGPVVIAILLVWHIFSRQRWNVRTKTLGVMAVESLALAVPLLMINIVIARSLPAASTETIAFADLDTASKMAISIGAGIYEELLFRMMLMAVVHTLTVDVARLSERSGVIIAVALSALAFTPYHDLSGPDGGLAASRVVFYLLAGAYFACVYWYRGFGIVVATHAFYDLLTVLLTPSE